MAIEPLSKSTQPLIQDAEKKRNIKTVPNGLQDLTNKAGYKEIGMAIGLAVSVIITAVAITSIAALLIFCPFAALPILALGILGAVGFVGALGTIHFSVQYAVARKVFDLFLTYKYLSRNSKIKNTSTIENIEEALRIKETFNDINKRLDKYKRAQRIVSPWLWISRGKHPSIVTQPNW